VLDLTVRQVRDPIQANTRGAAFIAAVGLGYLKYEDIPAMTEYEASYTPISQNRDIYDKVFEVFVKFYKQNKSLFKLLNG